MPSRQTTDDALNKDKDNTVSRATTANHIGLLKIKDLENSRITL